MKVMLKTFKIPFVIIILFLGCKNRSGLSNKDKMPLADTIKASAPFNCFTSIDTTATQIVKGCSGYYYKQIQGTFVLEIHYDSTIQFDSCFHIYVDTISSAKWVQLFTYKKGDASIFVYCNDYGDHHFPVGSSSKAFGDFYCKFYKSENLEPTVSIWINKLTFIDTITNHTTLISNELFWKVKDFGPSGG